MYDADKIKPQIVARIAAGDFLAQIAQTEGMPCESTINAWLMADAAFRVQCARAREASADVFEARVVQLADKVERGDLDSKAGAVALNALTWICKVRNRSVYGEKVEVDARVSIGGAILDRLARARGRVIDAEHAQAIEQDDSDSEREARAA